MLWRRSLTTRLVVSHLVATTTALLVLGGLTLAVVGYTQRTETVAALDARANVYALYAADLAQSPALLRSVAGAVVGRFPVEPNTTVRIFAVDGTLLTADDGLGPYPSREARPFLAAQMLTLSVAPTDRLYMARPIIRGDTTLGVVEVSRSLAAQRRPLRDLLLALLPGSALALVVATLLALALARGLLRPLHALRVVARRIADGDLTARASSTRPDEVGQLATTIDQMAHDLEARIGEVERLASARREFYRSVSHDLRTPLTAIRGLAENLEDTATDEQIRSLHILQSEAARLQRLVGDLLAGGEVASIRRQPLDLSALVQNIVDLMLPRAERGSVALHWQSPGPITVAGDADRLRQALVNLLDNALKWTQPGGSITVAVWRDSNRVTLSVADSGPGIAPDLREQVWERGVRGADGGQGLGLALVREAAEAHGGSADLGTGSGTIVCIHLPTTAVQAR